MVLCLVPITVFAAGGAKAILPGTSAQSILKIDKSKLSFAGHEWWVIGQKTDKSNNAPIITLLAVNNDFGDVPFRTGSAVPFENASRYSEDNGYYANNPSDMSQWRKPNEYAGSTLQQKMVSLAEAIPEKEQAVIRPKDITEGITGQEVKAQKLWALSHEDSIFLYRNSCTYAAKWWTRSSNEVYGYGSWTIHPDGRSGSALNVDYDAAVRPAMELDLSSVLFISAAEHGKVADLTTPIAEYAGDEWKLTLHDSDRDDFTAKTVLVNGSVLEVEYKNAKVGDNEYISAVIKDADGSISRYTRVVQLDGTTNGTCGRAAIDLTGIDMTGKTLCVFNEQFNGDHKTDYAGALREVKLTDEIDEQFTLTPGGRYYFDLSAMDIPGTVNSNLPDSTLHYVPFTYAGTVDAYKLTTETATTEEYAQKNKYPHSLFIADHTVTNNVSWDALNTAGLIFGKNYAAGGVDYTLRAPSVGSGRRGSGNDIECGTPQSNEWDRILDKDSGYIKNWFEMYSWGQDTIEHGTELYRAGRGFYHARQWDYFFDIEERPFRGFRPVLELPTDLAADSLKAVALSLGGGKLGNSSEDIQIILKTGSEFTAPASDGLTRPDGDTGSYFIWLGSNGKLYNPGDSVPAVVTTLTAQWKDTEKPTGEIKISENNWKAFLNNITFGLFFKDTQTVTITAADNSGETVTVEYLLSDKELTKAELDGMTFTAYTAPFGIDPDNEYIIYVRLTDKAGNTDYICSDGIVLDGTSPVITGIEYGKIYCEAQTVTVDEKYVNTITVNGTEVTLDENNSFTLAPADGEQKIIVTDKAGNIAEMTVTVNDGHTYGEWVSNGDGTHTRRCTVDGCNGLETKDCSGGTATCTEKAVCEVCGKAYGELDPKNHTDLKYIPAKAATEDSEGNIEYWYCEGCNKYYGDRDGTKEIKKADTVTAKLPKNENRPQTGENSNFILWIALLFISGGAVIGTAVTEKKKKQK